MIKTILNVLLFLSLVIVSFLTILRGVFIQDTQAAIDPSSIKKVEDKLNADTIHNVLDNFLKDYDIPTQVIDEIAESNEPQEILKEYTNEFITTALNGEELPEIPVDKIEKVLNKGIEKYNEKFGTDISLNKIKQMVEEFSEKITATLQLIHNNLQILQSFKVILNNTLYYGMLLLTAMLILILAIWQKKEALFSLGGISIFNGLVLLITYGILKLEQIAPLLKLLPIDVAEFQKSFSISGSAFTIVGILLLIMYRTVIYIQEKKEKENPKIRLTEE